jgi:hypothetical protein
VHRAGISVRGRVVPEETVEAADLEERIVSWPDDDPDCDGLSADPRLPDKITKTKG